MTATAPLPQTDTASSSKPQIEATKDGNVNTVKGPAIEPKKEPVSQPQQTKAADKENNTDFQLADILRVTGQFADFSTGQNSSLICDCCSPAGSDDLLCIICGAALGEVEEEVELVATLSCDDCGSTMESDEIFCPSCGSATFGA